MGSSLHYFSYCYPLPVTVIVNAKSEEGEITFDWIVRPYFAKFLCKFQGGIHACYSLAIPYFNFQLSIVNCLL